MAIYVIGDVQGCYHPLKRLLKALSFQEASDTLWFVGDLINRGPDSLSVLQFIQDLPNKKIVLGNHDLHFLAVAYGLEAYRKKDTFRDILDSPQSQELADFLRQQPLLYLDDERPFGMVHAGIPPQWSLLEAEKYANEVSTVLQSDDPKPFLSEMYGNTPLEWSDTLKGNDRLRIITNYFTRMRICDQNGKLELDFKGLLGTQIQGYQAWYAWPNRWSNPHFTLLFGHWAALGGLSHADNVIALDTGCGWGHLLTAFRLDDRHFMSVNNPN